MSGNLVDIVLYLIPSLLLAAVMRLLAGKNRFCALLLIAGTFMHELMHFVVGLMLGARPVSASLIPKRRPDGSFVLGSVSFASIRWYSAAPVALAPLAIITVPFLVASVRCAGTLAFQPWDLLLAFLIAPQFLCCWPSSTDWRLSMKSWPLFLLAGAAVWYFYPYVVHSLGLERIRLLIPH